MLSVLLAQAVEPASEAAASIVDDRMIHQFVATGIYSLFGMLLFAIAFFVMCKVAPFSVKKEIEDDQNTSLAILMGSVIIGIAIIVGSAVSGG